MSNHCSVCGHDLYGFAVTDPDGSLVVMDVIPICESCLAELLEDGVSIEELI